MFPLTAGLLLVAAGPPPLPMGLSFLASWLQVEESTSGVRTTFTFQPMPPPAPTAPVSAVWANRSPPSEAGGAALIGEGWTATTDAPELVAAVWAATGPSRVAARMAPLAVGRDGTVSVHETGEDLPPVDIPGLTLASARSTWTKEEATVQVCAFYLADAAGASRVIPGREQDLLPVVKMVQNDWVSKEYGSGGGGGRVPAMEKKLGAEVVAVDIGTGAEGYHEVWARKGPILVVITADHSPAERRAETEALAAVLAAAGPGE